MILDAFSLQGKVAVVSGCTPVWARAWRWGWQSGLRYQ